MERGGGVRRRSDASRRAVLGLGLAGLVDACTSSRRPPALAMWAQSTEGENAPRILPPFTASTGLSVDLQALPWTAAHEKILTAYAGNALPDLMMVRNSWVGELAMLDALGPVPPPLANDMFPGALRSVAVDGRPRALPWVIDTLVQFYRPDILAAAGYPAPPPSWAEWTRMARAIRRQRPDKWVVLMLLDWPEHLFGYAVQQPEPLLRDQATRGNFSSAGFRAALAHYKSLFDEGLAPPIVGTQMGDLATSLGQGWTAILPGAADLVGDFHNRGIAADSWAAAEMPGPEGLAAGLVTGASLAVPARAHDPAASWTLARYLCEPETQRRFHDITGSLPSRRSAWDAPGLRDDATAQVFRRQLDRGVPPPAIPEWPRIETEVQLIAERMVRGEFGVDGAARAMDDRVDRLLAKRRWLLDRGLAA